MLVGILACHQGGMFAAAVQVRVTHRGGCGGPRVVRRRQVVRSSRRSTGAEKILDKGWRLSRTEHVIIDARGRFAPVECGLRGRATAWDGNRISGCVPASGWRGDEGRVEDSLNDAGTGPLVEDVTGGKERRGFSREEEKKTKSLFTLMLCDAIVSLKVDRSVLIKNEGGLATEGTGIASAWGGIVGFCA